jgi:hypothetical protein
MITILLLLVSRMLNQGVQINAHDMRIDIVRTDQQPASERHQVLDHPSMARLRPFTVTIRTKGEVAIHAMTVVFTIVDANGVTQTMPMFYDGPNDGKFAVVHPGGSTAFWPDGRVYNKLPPYRPAGAQPLITKPSDQQLDLLENAKSVTVSVPYIEFADGTVYDEGGWAAKVAESRQRMLSRRAQRGIK